MTDASQPIATCRIEARGGHFFIRGHLNESADFAPIIAQSGMLRLNFRSVVSMNSFGLGTLLAFANGAQTFGRIEYYDLPQFMVEAVGNVPRLLGPRCDPKVIKSIFVRYRCNSCDLGENEVSVPTAELLVTARSVSAPPAACAKCGSTMRLTEDPDLFLIFAVN